MSDGKQKQVLIALSFIAFISLGLPDGTIGVAWPSIRGTFGKPLGYLGVLLACSIVGYLVSSFSCGQITKLVGIGSLLVGSSLFVTVAMVGTSLTPSWLGMMLFAVIGGLGAGAIDAGLNTFAASKFSPRIVNWMHAFWGIGATCGPLLMTAVLSSQGEWRIGYLILGMVLGILSLIFFLSRRIWANGFGTAQETHVVASIFTALRSPVVWLQVLLFFVYGGIESSAGQLLYSLFTESRGMALAAAGITVGAYWGALSLGRIVFGQLAARIAKTAVLRIGMLSAPIAAMLIWWNPTPQAGPAGAVLLGLVLAPLFPTLIADTPQRVGGACTPHAVGFQVSAGALGIAFFPGAIGALAQRLGLEVLGAYLFFACVMLLVLNELTMRYGDTLKAT